MYVPIVAVIALLAAIPITAFLRTGFGTNGSAIGGAGAAGDAPPPVIAKAVGELRTRIARNPRDVEALEMLAGLETEAGRLPQALQLQAQAVAAAPRDAAVRATYAETLNDLGQSTEARKQLDLVLRIQPRNADAFYERGVIDERLGLHDRAQADFQAFLTLAKPNDPRRAALTGTSGARP